jgi:hypothetical protein
VQAAARRWSRCWRGSGHPHDTDTYGPPDSGLCAAVDVHYLSTGGARAAAVLAADAAFAHVRPRVRLAPHDAEDGASAPLLMTKSGHSSLRTLGRYARPGTEALAAWQQQTDRTRRGRD